MTTRATAGCREFVRCPTCGDAIELTGDEANRNADEAWFVAKHPATPHGPPSMEPAPRRKRT